MKLLIEAQILIDTNPEEKEEEPKEPKPIVVRAWKDIPPELKKTLESILPEEFIKSMKKE